jgi:hypothetical protein
MGWSKLTHKQLQSCSPDKGKGRAVPEPEPKPEPGSGSEKIHQTLYDKFKVVNPGACDHCTTMAHSSKHGDIDVWLLSQEERDKVDSRSHGKLMQILAEVDAERRKRDEARRVGAPIRQTHLEATRMANQEALQEEAQLQGGTRTEGIRRLRVVLTEKRALNEAEDVRKDANGREEAQVKLARLSAAPVDIQLPQPDRPTIVLRQPSSPSCAFGEKFRAIGQDVHPKSYAYQPPPTFLQPGRRRHTLPPPTPPPPPQHAMARGVDQSSQQPSLELNIFNTSSSEIRQRTAHYKRLSDYMKLRHETRRSDRHPPSNRDPKSPRFSD